jgi:adenine-specific DNA methylase
MAVRKSEQRLMEWAPEGEHQKATGAYYTPRHVVSSLVAWAIRSPEDYLLDPSCGDGRFLLAHKNSVGVEEDPNAAALVRARCTGAEIHQSDFFLWAAHSPERFDCVVGNPPFIRYQRFTGKTRERALKLCQRIGASFTSLTSSWAPFIAAAASLLKKNGRLAFVVPAEIGHAPYAVPLVRYLVANFAHVQLIAVRDRLFPELSEDCWLLYCEGFGGQADTIGISRVHEFAHCARPPKIDESITIAKYGQWNSRLRPFLLPGEIRDLYQSVRDASDALPLGKIAKVGIGYVTGANDFFHLRPSQAEKAGIPESFLVPAVRNGRSLPVDVLCEKTIHQWRKADDPSFLLRIKRDQPLPKSITAYLHSDAGQIASQTYKCRNRAPWYVVPDVRIPDAFLSYMAGETPSLVINRARCAGTNSVHVVRLLGACSIRHVQRLWKTPFTELSCEIEGHPLGGGMLKVEPGEVARVLLLDRELTKKESLLVRSGIDTLRRWRHYG